MTRATVASGTFYPANPNKLKEFIKNATPRNITPQEAKAVILPHAGYIYSGKVAVETVANIRPKKLLVALGPNHTGRGLPFSVYTQGCWQTPLGDIEIEPETAQEITKTRILEADIQAHAYEHSIEVQLPILKYFFEEFKFIPIACILADLAVYKEIAGIIYTSLEKTSGFAQSLIIASSDMTHYESQAQAEKKDKYVLEAILNLDTSNFLKRVQEKNVSMCGIAPVGIMLEFLKLSQAKKSRLIKYTTSAEASGDYSSVVGYAGAIFN
ncbi:MAG: AmmeMemoRadiSam system protein B [Candidatus Omnitrophica bacterium]|nr:AmmeMemoRadiSam system protein B [Candidatus Omnitrophota bacterium]